MTKRSTHCNMRLTALAVLCVLAVSVESTGGTIISHDIQSPAIAGNTMGISSVRRITVHLPDDYEKGISRYPVIYYIPGFGGSGEVVIDGLGDASRDRDLPPAITVIVDASEGLVFLNSPEFGCWEDFLIDELIPFVDQRYRTIQSMRGRALIGHSMGGLTALLVPLLRPNIWGSIGLNDGSAYYAGFYESHVGKEGEIPCALRGDFETVMEAWKNMPASLDGYSSATVEARLLIQLGLAISPNPSAPLHFDPPIDKSGKPVKKVLEKWRAYCLFDPVTIARQRPAFATFSTIALIVPELDGATTNAYQNLYWSDLMTAAGIPVTRIDSPGGHSDLIVERLVALEEVILNAR